MSLSGRWLLTGLLVIVPRITAWVLNWTSRRSTRRCRSCRRPAAGQADRRAHSRLRRGAHAADSARSPVVWPQFCGPQAGSVGDSSRRISGAFDLFERQAGLGHAVLPSGGTRLRTAVLVQWPREGVWTVASTARPRRGVCCLRSAWPACMCRPRRTRTGGYFVMMRKSDCIDARHEHRCRAEIHRVDGRGDSARSDRSRIQTINKHAIDASQEGAGS